MAPAPPGSRADAHTRLVGAAKLALPLGGLALLSSLFLLAGDGEPPAAPLASEVRGIAREQRLSAPVHAGVTADGDAVEVSARLARPDPHDPRIMKAEAIRARVTRPGGARVDLAAPEGVIDTGAGTATLSGGLSLEGSGGIAVEAAAVTVYIDAGRVEATGPVRGQAPFGRIEAGTLTVEGDRAEFGSGVRLVYDPARAAVAE